MLQKYIGGLCMIPARSRTKWLCALVDTGTTALLNSFKRKTPGLVRCCGDVIHASEESEGGQASKANKETTLPRRVPAS